MILWKGGSGMLRKFLSNTFFLVLTALTIVVLFIYLSYSTQAWHWFGRSGSLITMIGVILGIRPIIRMGYSKWKENLNIIDLGHIEPTPEDQEKDRQESKDSDALLIGGILSIIGTLIWAYGDLMGDLLKFII